MQQEVHTRIGHLTRFAARFGYDAAISQLLTVPPYVCASEYFAVSGEPY